MSNKKLAKAIAAVAAQMEVANKVNVQALAAFHKMTDEQADQLLKGVGL